MSTERRRKKDHERYMLHREERLARQRSYYADNREACIAAVKRCRNRAIIAELEKMRLTTAVDIDVS